MTDGDAERIRQRLSDPDYIARAADAIAEDLLSGRRRLYGSRGGGKMRRQENRETVWLSEWPYTAEPEDGRAEQADDDLHAAICALEAAPKKVKKAPSDPGAGQMADLERRRLIWLDAAEFLASRGHRNISTRLPAELRDNGGASRSLYLERADYAAEHTVRECAKHWGISRDSAASSCHRWGIRHKGGTYEREHQAEA